MGQALEQVPAWSTDGGSGSTEKDYIMWRLMRQKKKGKKKKNEGTPRREREDKNIKLYGQDPRTTLARLCTSTLKYHDYPPSGDQGLAFQVHALQVILFGPLTCEPNIILGSSRIESLQYI